MGSSARLLLKAVARSLDDTSAKQGNDELIELHLELGYRSTAKDYVVAHPVDRTRRMQPTSV
jgi:hypothetical protein